MTESQRNRIHQAMIEVVSERGYPETRVVDVIGVAGVSRKTFYELFDSKEDCFLAAYDVLLGNLLGDTAGGFESKPGAPWAERVAAGLGALLEHLAEHPDEARFAIVEVLAAGPEGARPPRRRAAPVHRLPRVGPLGDLGRAAGDHRRSRSPAASTSCSTARSSTAPPRGCRAGCPT